MAGVDPEGPYAHPVRSPTYWYKFRRSDQAAIEQRIKEICQTRVQFGCRRVNVLLRRDGWEINAKKTYRIQKELGMQLCNKTPKRRVKAKLRDDRKDAVRANDVWTMDFVHDQLATGHKIRILTIVDTFSRTVPALDAWFSDKGKDVVTPPDRVCRQVDFRKTIRVNNGSEFILCDLDFWAYKRNAKLDFSLPGKPTDNACSEASKARFGLRGMPQLLTGSYGLKIRLISWRLGTSH